MPSGNASRARRVLQVITPSHMGGAEMQVIRLSRRMSARGHQISMLVKRGSAAVDEMRRHEFELEEAAIGGKINILSMSRLASAARRRRAEILHSHLSSASWWCGWLEKVGGPRSIGHVHGFTSAAWHRGQTHLLAVSGAVRDHLVSRGIGTDRITVLYNALGPEEFRASRDALSVRREFGADNDTPVIGTFAHLSVKKGYRELFAAMPQVLARVPNAQFWIMGTGPLRNELETFARRRGFLDRVRLAGFRRDAADVMNAIDVMALPSRREPCALVYIEAALMGETDRRLPSWRGAESIADRQTGLLVPVNDPQAIAEAILNLLENRSVAVRMGKAGRDRAQDLFSWNRYLATLESAYEKVLAA